MLHLMANTTKQSDTRIGLLLRAPEKALIKRIQKKLTTAIGKPTAADVLRDGLLALAEREGVK